MKASFNKHKIITLSTKGLITFVWHFVAPYKLAFFFGAFCRLIGDIVWLYHAYAFAEVVNLLTNDITEATLERFWGIIMVWFVVVFIRPLAMNIGKYYGYGVAEKASIDVYKSTLQHALQLNIDWHEKENTGNKMERISKGLEAVNALIRILFDYLIEIVVNFVGMLYIFSLFDINISLMIGGFAIFYLGSSLLLSKRAAQEHYKTNVAWEGVSGSSYEMMNNIHTVKLLQMRPKLLKTLKKQFKYLLTCINNRIFWYRIRQIVNIFEGEAFRVGLVLYIALGVINGDYEIGFLVLFYGYFSRIWESVHELAEVSDRFTTYKYGIQRMMELREEPITIESDKGKKKAPIVWKQLVLKDISFNYGKNQVLRDFNLTIKKGEKIGIVGLSGAGKSTLFKLLLKQYEDYEGRILLDDIDVKTLTKSSYLGLTAVVPQETELFNLPLEDNITLASPELKSTNIARLKKSIKIAHIDTFLPKLKQGLKTLVGEKGVKLSGGEKQRLGIARAVYRDPQILFLDEATSHLDIESERNIQQALHDFFKEVTAVVIAHRLSTIKAMDRIIVLEKGLIVEEGSFEVLMKQEGRFYELWQQQLFD